MIKKLLNFRSDNKKKYLLALEYGFVISQVAKVQEVEITPDLIKKAEAMIEGEFSQKDPTRLSVEMLPNVMSVFELDMTK